MPTRITVGGRTTYRPRIIGETDGSALASKSLTDKVVAIVGDMDIFEAAVVSEYTDAARLIDVDPTSRTLELLAKLLYRHERDARLGAGPAKTVLVSPTTTTQALKVLLDSDSAESIVLKAPLWGPTGNRTRIGLTANAGDATLRDLVLARDGVTETWTGLGSGPVASFGYDGDEADTMTVGLESDGTIRIKQTKALAIADGAFAPSEMCWDGALVATPDAAISGGTTIQLHIEGVSKTTGLAVSEDLQWVGPDVTAKTSAHEYADITELQVTAEAGGPWTDNIGIAADAFVLSASVYAAVADAVDRVNQFAGRGFAATVLNPRAASQVLTEMDVLAQTTIAATTASIRADVWAWLDKLAASGLVQAERGSTGTKPPVALVGTHYLSGGTRTTPATSGWTAALAALEETDARIVVVLSDTEAVQSELEAHLLEMAGVGASPRQGWMAPPASTTLTNMLTWARSHATRHCGRVFQEIQVTRANGTTEWLEPYWFAVHAAGMQASVPIAEPLTRKRPTVLDLRQHTSIVPKGDANLLIENGLVFAVSDRLSFRIERSVSGHLEDDNPAFSEMSTVESFNASILDLQGWLDYLIGSRNLATTRGRIESIVKSRLRQQILDGIIKGFLASSVLVVDRGDYYTVDYSVEGVEPNNWIVLRAHASRSSAAA